MRALVEGRAALVDQVVTCRTRLLGIPSKAKQQLPHLSLSDLEVLEALVREALEGLVPSMPPRELRGCRPFEHVVQSDHDRNTLPNSATQGDLIQGPVHDIFGNLSQGSISF